MNENTICKVDDCDRDLRQGGVGYCKMHYSRFVRNGSPTATGGRRTKATPVIAKLGPAGQTPCMRFDNVPKFDAVVELTVWWTGFKPGAGAQAVIDEAKAVCATCPIRRECRTDARRENLNGVVGGEYRPATATGGGRLSDSVPA